MSSIDTRAPFFPQSKTARAEVAQAKASQAQALQRNSYERAKEIEGKTSRDAQVSIPETIRDFSRIKKAVDAAPEIDNSDRVADIKARIQAGTYSVDYDGLADKLLQSEF